MNMSVLALMFAIAFAALMLLTYAIVYEQLLFLVTVAVVLSVALALWPRRSGPKDRLRPV